jgi:hypothetical protein
MLIIKNIPWSIKTPIDTLASSSRRIPMQNARSINHLQGTPMIVIDIHHPKIFDDTYNILMMKQEGGSQGVFSSCATSWRMKQGFYHTIKPPSISKPWIFIFFHDGCQLKKMMTSHDVDAIEARGSFSILTSVAVLPQEIRWRQVQLIYAFLYGVFHFYCHHHNGTTRST